MIYNADAWSRSLYVGSSLFAALKQKGSFLYMFLNEVKYETFFSFIFLFSDSDYMFDLIA